MSLFCFNTGELLPSSSKAMIHQREDDRGGRHNDLHTVHLSFVFPCRQSCSSPHPKINLETKTAGNSQIVSGVSVSWGSRIAGWNKDLWSSHLDWAWGQGTQLASTPQPVALGSVVPAHHCCHPGWGGPWDVDWGEMTHLSPIVTSALTRTASRPGLWWGC
jgi:hypothetical protein